MEVFWVRICLPDVFKGRRGIYGTVTVISARDSQDIFNRPETDCQFIGAGESDLLLTGPRRCISVRDFVYIVVALKDKDSNSADFNYPPKHECSYGCDSNRVGCGSYTMSELIGVSAPFNCPIILGWSPFHTHDSYYDKPKILTTRDSDLWSVKVNCAPLTAAVRANFMVKLMTNNKNELDADDAYVYGRITARCGGFTEGTVLFQKDKMSSGSDRAVEVRKGELIPLSRSFVVLQSSSSLEVLVDLWDRNRDDAHLAEGIEEFPVQLGPNRRHICGQFFNIQVKLTFTEIRF